MIKSSIDPSESIQTAGRTRSEAVENFKAMEPDSNDCLLFSDYEECRKAYGNISNWCRSNKKSHRPSSSRVKSGWAIWKKTRGKV